MPREEIAFTAWPKIHSHSQIFRYSRNIFCLPHRPNFSDIFDLCLYWMSVVRGCNSFSAAVYIKVRIILEKIAHPIVCTGIFIIHWPYIQGQFLQVSPCKIQVSKKVEKPNSHYQMLKCTEYFPTKSCCWTLLIITIVFLPTFFQIQMSLSQIFQF